MITIDIAQIEVLIDLLVKSASDADEVLSRLRSVATEIQNDVELPLYAQADVVLESVALAIQALNRGTDTLLSLKGTMMPVADIYRENEKNNKDALSRMTAYIDSVKTGFSAAISTYTIPQAEHSDSVSSQSKVQQLVADSVSEMQATNIAAITKVVKEEYEAKTIKSLETDT